MYAFSQDPELSKEEFDLFREFIHEKAGIHFADNKMYLLKNRLAKRMQDLGVKSYKDYFYRVKYDVTMKEFNQLMNLVTTNETSFFRNPPQLKSFSEEALSRVVQDKLSGKGTKTLKIWSAGCSTGEEPYTLAILVLEYLKSTIGWNVEIIACDISEGVLSAARTGVYGDITLRTTPPNIRERYFTQNEGKYHIVPEVKKLVRFGHLNLNDSRKLSMYSDMDFVFCRNVMIYFSDDVKKKIVRGFYNALKPGGYLYIGHSESLHGISKAFKLVYFKNALVYHKEAKRAASDATAEAASEQGVGKAMDLLKQIKPMTVK
jgi:chemotaxis protein methyltransferase CheR